MVDEEWKSDQGELLPFSVEQTIEVSIRRRNKHYYRQTEGKKPTTQKSEKEKQFLDYRWSGSYPVEDEHQELLQQTACF